LILVFDFRRLEEAQRPKTKDQKPKTKNKTFLPIIVHISASSRPLLVQIIRQLAPIHPSSGWHELCTSPTALNHMFQERTVKNMLWTILLVLLVLWLLGLIGGVGGNLVHLLLLVALVVLVLQLITGRRAVV
jgi:hypothetical protein